MAAHFSNRDQITQFVERYIIFKDNLLATLSRFFSRIFYDPTIMVTRRPHLWRTTWGDGLQNLQGRDMVRQYLYYDELCDKFVNETTLSSEDGDLPKGSTKSNVFRTECYIDEDPEDYPYWNEDTFNLIKTLFTAFDESDIGALPREKFGMLLECTGDESSNFRRNECFAIYAKQPSVGITYNEVCKFLYNYTSSADMRDYRLMYKVKEMGRLYRTSIDIPTDFSVEYGLY